MKDLRDIGLTLRSGADIKIGISIDIRHLGDTSPFLNDLLISAAACVLTRMGAVEVELSQFNLGRCLLRIHFCKCELHSLHL